MFCHFSGNFEKIYIVEDSVGKWEIGESSEFFFLCVCVLFTGSDRVLFLYVGFSNIVNIRIQNIRQFEMIVSHMILLVMISLVLYSEFQYFRNPLNDPFGLFGYQQVIELFK